MMDVYTSPTPNGIKVPIALEELGLPYRLHRVDLSRGGIAVPELVAINPNAKIPAIIDRLADGQSVPMFESGAILLYLAGLKPGLVPTAAIAHASTLSWLFLQVAGLGPNFGNAGFFLRNDPSNRVAIERFQGEARRHLALLEQRLAECEWLNGESYSIADIAHFGWVRSAAYAGLKLSRASVCECMGRTHRTAGNCSARHRAMQGLESGLSRGLSGLTLATRYQPRSRC
ncbi:MAG: glutathione S-transferase N-terminal domain-containing protein [Haliea sp.]|nr:glutathione S-transferase N-terminal domain-containing protein [Haliea sp.]